MSELRCECEGCVADARKRALDSLVVLGAWAVTLVWGYWLLTRIGACIGRL